MDAAESLPAGAEPAVIQPEVEPLLSQVAGPEIMAVIPNLDAKKDQRSENGIQPYDFRQPAFLSPAELRKLRSWHEEFIRLLAARLSMYLRLEVGIGLPKMQTIAYEKFIEGLSDPTYLTLFKAEPMRGISILEIPPRLGLTLVDRLLGGSAQAVNFERELSEIEVALLDQVIQIILEEWCHQWHSLLDLHPVVLAHESIGRFLQIVPGDTAMFVLSAEVRVGDCLDQLQMVFPCSALEPLVGRLTKNLNAGANETPPGLPPALQWNQNLAEITIPVTAEWHGIEITARQVAQFKVGDVLELGPGCADHVQLRLANLPKFIGRLGTRGNHWAVETIEVIKC
jgi:flagellar motor switch protein FliM